MLGLARLANTDVSLLNASADGSSHAFQTQNKDNILLQWQDVDVFICQNFFNSTFVSSDQKRLLIDSF